MHTDFNQTQYQKHADQYLTSNEDGLVGGTTPEKRAQLISQFLPKGSTIFEIGSGGGLDARALLELGFNVTASDYVSVFVEKLQAGGLDAVMFDTKQDHLKGEYDCVYANAVFVHFSPEEIQSFLQKIRTSLTGKKIVFASVIKGEGSERSGRSRGFERDFHYYLLTDIDSIAESAGYTVIQHIDVDAKWLQVILSVS